MPTGYQAGAVGRPLCYRQRGMALIELALFGGILITLSIVVIGDFGRMLMLGEQLTAAAEAGALYAYQTWNAANDEGNLAANTTRVGLIKAAVRNGAWGASGTPVLATADITVTKACNFCPIDRTDPSNPVSAMYNTDTEEEIVNPSTTLDPQASCADVDVDDSPWICEGYGPVPITYTITVRKDFYPITPGLRQIIGNPRRVTRTASYRVR